MNSIQKEEIRQELHRVLGMMNISKTMFDDYNWLDQNLGVDNQNHPNFIHAKWLIQKLRKGEQ